MSSLSNRQIEDRVNLIVEAYVKNAKTKITPDDKQLIEAGTELVVNFLQNLNDIAYAAANLDVTLSNSRM